MGWKSILNKAGLGWFFSNAWHQVDWRDKSFYKDIKVFLQEEVNRVQYLDTPYFKNPKNPSDNDTTMLNIQRWIKQYIRYMNDFDKHKTLEYWQNARETYETRSGDCEDGAVLMFALARKARISPAKLRLVAGEVFYNGKIQGHCWVEYFSDAQLKWHVIDWCWLPDMRTFDKKATIEEATSYQKRWWKVNDWGLN